MSALRSFRGGRGGRRLWVVGATLVAAAAFGVVFVASSGAAPSLVSDSGQLRDRRRHDAADLQPTVRTTGTRRTSACSRPPRAARTDLRQGRRRPQQLELLRQHAGQDELRSGVCDQPRRQRRLLRLRRVGADGHERYAGLRDRDHQRRQQCRRRRHAAAEARQWRIGLLHLLPGIVRTGVRQRLLVHHPVELRADLHQLEPARGRHHGDQHRLDQRPAEPAPPSLRAASSRSLSTSRR